MDLLPGTTNCGLRMCRECMGRFARHRLKRKPLFSDPGMHHGTCVTHVPWCMSGSQTRGSGEIVPGISGPCATRNFAYLVRLLLLLTLIVGSKKIGNLSVFSLTAVSQHRILQENDVSVIMYCTRDFCYNAFQQICNKACPLVYIVVIWHWWFY